MATAKYYHQKSSSPEMKAASAGKVVIDVGRQGDWDGGSLKWDYCLTFPKVPKDAPYEKHKTRRSVIRAIKETGLTTSKTYSRDDDEVFLRLTASLPVFEDKAEAMKLAMRKKAEFGGGYAPFERNLKRQFEGSGPGKLFTAGERIQIIQFALEGPKHDGGAELDIDQLIFDKQVGVAFPMRSEPECTWLVSNWAKAFFRKQPLDKVEEYFGPQVAMYFGYLGYYTNWLFFVGIVASVFQYTDKGPTVTVYDSTTGTSTEITPPSYDGKATPFYCIFLCLAVTVFLEGWKRQQATFACQWNQQDYEKQERTRAEYKGKPDIGFWNRDGDWISLEDLRNRPEFPEKMITNKHARKSFLLFAWGWVVVTTWVFSVIVAALALLAFKVILKKTRGATAAAVGGGLSFSLFIQITNQLYKRVALWLNNKENHRTDSAFTDSLISKIFLFQFVNSYVSFFYIAFVKGTGVVVLGYAQECLAAVTGGPPNCMYELNKQLSWIFIFQILIGNLLEVVLPWFIGRIKICCENRKVKKLGNLDNQKMSQAEYEAKLQPYASPFDDYNEMIIQFGFVTLFAAGFPAAAMLALVNNLIEIRSDAIKLLVATKRPPIAGAQDIGTWYEVLEAMSTMSVITNTLILCVTSTTLDEFFAGQDNATLKKVLVALVVEHAVFILKWAIAKFVPDVPESVRVKLARAEFLRELEIQKALQGPGDSSARRSSKGVDAGYVSEPTDTE